MRHPLIMLRNGVPHPGEADMMLIWESRDGSKVGKQKQEQGQEQEQEVSTEADSSKNEFRHSALIDLHS